MHLTLQAYSYVSTYNTFRGNLTHMASRQYKPVFKNDTGLKLWELRHAKVLQFIEQKFIKTVIDIGCNDATLIQKIQRGTMVQHLIGLDIDQSELLNGIDNIQPQMNQKDIQYQRRYSQKVSLYLGSALQPHPLLLSYQPQLITLIQVIEHIQLVDIPILTKNIFQYFHPEYVFISTPNQQFNQLFQWEKGRVFRHDDHRFQWTRQQFRIYVQQVAIQYHYEFVITGVGEALDPTFDKGFCSQIAIFKRINKYVQQQSLQTQQQSFQTQQQSFQTQQQQSTVFDYFKFIKQQRTNNKDKQQSLKLMHSHVNKSWLQNKQDLIQTAILQVVFLSRHLQVITWMQFLKQCKKKTIISKLMSYENKYHDDHILIQQLKPYLQKLPLLTFTNDQIHFIQTSISHDSQLNDLQQFIQCQFQQQYERTYKSRIIRKTYSQRSESEQSSSEMVDQEDEKNQDSWSQDWIETPSNSSHYRMQSQANRTHGEQQ